MSCSRNLSVFLWILTGAIAPTFVPNTYAQTINSPSQMSSTASRFEFENLPVGTKGPLTSGNMTITAFNFNVEPQVQPQSPPGFVIAQNLGIFDGQWFGAYSVGGEPSDFRFDFALPVSQFGLGVLDATFDGDTLTAFDASGNQLFTVASFQGSPFFPTFPESVQPGQSSFIGFISATNNISTAILSRNGNGRDFFGIDSVRYYSTPPAASVADEPSSIQLLSCVLVGCMAFLRPRSRKSCIPAFLLNLYSPADSRSVISPCRSRLASS